ncbi:hypothetical protein LguiA_026264 [Lonicera macranthoides]
MSEGKKDGTPSFKLEILSYKTKLRPNIYLLAKELKSRPNAEDLERPQGTVHASHYVQPIPEMT